ncbi:MAG TPA: acetolactate synthase small subunit [Dysgonamonadaceae bacterium]|nr:acetolactate synthase small subunit [Dysgonamonadaceae bacterium]
MQEKTLYTITVFSENVVGVLSQITAIFTRRQINIETLSVSPSAISGIHKFTITAWARDEDTMKKLVKQIDKRVDVLKAYYNIDDELVHQEIALYKIETEKLVATSSVEELLRKHNARILDVSDHSTIIQKTGHYAETQLLFDELSESTGVLQFIRSGRVAITKSKVERLSDLLARRALIDLEKAKTIID